LRGQRRSSSGGDGGGAEARAAAKQRRRRFTHAARLPRCWRPVLKNGVAVRRAFCGVRVAQPCTYRACVSEFRAPLVATLVPRAQRRTLLWRPFPPTRTAVSCQERWTRGGLWPPYLFQRRWAQRLAEVSRRCLCKPGVASALVAERSSCSGGRLTASHSARAIKWSHDWTCHHVKIASTYCYLVFVVSFRSVIDTMGTWSSLVPNMVPYIFVSTHN
jgi:hypothetical protein